MVDQNTEIITIPRKGIAKRSDKNVNVIRTKFYYNVRVVPNGGLQAGPVCVIPEWKNKKFILYWRIKMSVKFNVVERGNPANQEAPKKFYPSIQSSGRMTLRELAEQASQMSTLTSVDMMAAIESFLTIVPRELAKGNIVELGDFGNFWLKSTSEGAGTPEEVRGTQITSIMPRFNPGKEFRRVLDNTEFEKLPYAGE